MKNHCINGQFNEYSLTSRVATRMVISIKQKTLYSQNCTAFISIRIFKESLNSQRSLLFVFPCTFSAFKITVPTRVVNSLTPTKCRAFKICKTRFTHEFNTPSLRRSLASLRSSELRRDVLCSVDKSIIYRRALRCGLIQNNTKEQKNFGKTLKKKKKTQTSRQILRTMEIRSTVSHKSFLSSVGGDLESNRQTWQTVSVDDLFAYIYIYVLCDLTTRKQVLLCYIASLLDLSTISHACEATPPPPRLNNSKQIVS